MVEIGNKEQRETIDMLHSRVDDLQLALDEDGSIVFDGEGQDGPSVGHIELDGKVTWLVCG